MSGDNIKTFPKSPRWSGDPAASRMMIDLVEPTRLEMVRYMHAYRVLVGPIPVANECLRVLESWK